MAAKVSNNKTDIKKRKDSEKKEREKREKKELLIRQKEKVKKKNARLERIHRREKKERKRINYLIKFPFQVLFQISLIFGLLFFIIVYYGYQELLIKAIFEAFLVYSAIYLGVGAIIVVISYMISENKKHEHEEQQKLLEEEQKIKDDIQNQKESKIELELRDAERKRAEELRRFRERKLNDSTALASGLPQEQDNHLEFDFPENFAPGEKIVLDNDLLFSEGFPQNDIRNESMPIK
jgi:hypothetical protein